VPTPLEGWAERPPAAAFQLGINEALAVPAAVRTVLRQSDVDDALAADASQALTLGARLVRAHTYNFPRVSCDRLARTPSAVDDMDSWVRALGPDLVGVGMVSPWPGNQTANHTARYLPESMDAWATCVGELVERYDGDGVRDMPGLRAPVRYWEVDNEPDLKNTQVPKHAAKGFNPSLFCPPEEYAAVLLRASEAIRAASPEAVVLALGLYRPHAASGQAYARRVLAVSGVPESFDILSLHTYHDDDGERLAGGIRAISQLSPDKPVWVTEASVTVAAGELEQGRRVAAYAAWAAMAGAERLFWHTLTDPPGRTQSRRGSGHFSTNSLLQAVEGGVPVEKPAGAVFRHLAAQLLDHDLAGAVADGEGAARLLDGSVLLFAGSRVAPAGGLSLLTGEPVGPGISATAPAWLHASPRLDAG
jgi:hypothetical protein